MDMLSAYACYYPAPLHPAAWWARHPAHPGLWALVIAVHLYRTLQYLDSIYVQMSYYINVVCSTAAKQGRPAIAGAKTTECYPGSQCNLVR